MGSEKASTNGMSRPTAFAASANDACPLAMRSSTSRSTLPRSSTNVNTPTVTTKVADSCRNR